MAILAECPICKRKQSNKRDLCSYCGEDLEKAKRSKRVRYWIDYRIPGGKHRRELVGRSIEKARDAMGKRRAQKREGRIFDMMPESKMTFNELTEWYLSLEKVRSLSSFWHIKTKLKKFNAVFGDMVVGKIKPIDLENYQAARMKNGLAAATIDHDIKSAKTMVSRAFDNDLIDGQALKTFKRVKKLLKRGKNARDRILSPGEFDRLIEHSPRHTKWFVAAGYYTGMRRGEIVSLTWDKVDLKKRVIRLDAEDTKDNERRNIPICDALYKVLSDIPRAIHDDHVFLFKGKPITDIRDGLQKGCNDAGIIYGRNKKNGFVFHDLRHTFNTNMRKAGVPRSVIMEITGHSTREMFDRYNTVDSDDTRKAVDQMSAFLQDVDKTLNETKKQALI